jgi:hypothetical protein
VQALIAVAFSVLYLGLETMGRHLGFPQQPMPFREVYWLFVAVMTAVGGLVALSVIVMLIPIGLLLWVQLRHPTAWRQMRQLNPDRVELNVSSQLIVIGGLLFGCVMFLWPAFRIWFLG